jgi:isopentenyl phosphate kinase
VFQLKVVVKLGGSLISKKKAVEKGNLKFPSDIERITAFFYNYIKRNVLNELTDEIIEAKEKDPNLQLILTNGVGPFGHELVHQGADYNLIHKSVSLLNTILRGTLREKGLETLEISPYDFCVPLIKNGTAEREHTNLISKLVYMAEQGIIPISYGDVIPINPTLLELTKPKPKRNYLIMSADDIINSTGQEWRADRIIAVSDVAGVYSNFGSPNQTLAKKIITDKPFNEKMRDLEITFPKAKDQTGEMETKLMKLYNFTQKSRITSIIMGAEKGQLHRALLGDEVGTTIVSVDQTPNATF